MATILFRKSDNEVECVKIEAELVPDHIACGWGFSKEGLEDLPVVNVDPKQLSNLEVRKAAEEAGIEGFDTRRINNLRAELDDNEIGSY